MATFQCLILTNVDFHFLNAISSFEIHVGVSHTLSSKLLYKVIKVIKVIKGILILIIFISDLHYLNNWDSSTEEIEQINMVFKSCFS